ARCGRARCRSPAKRAPVARPDGGVVAAWPAPGKQVTPRASAARARRAVLVRPARPGPADRRSGGGSPISRLMRPYTATAEVSQAEARLQQPISGHLYTAKVRGAHQKAIAASSHNDSQEVDRERETLSI